MKIKDIEPHIWFLILFPIYIYNSVDHYVVGK